MTAEQTLQMKMAHSRKAGHGSHVIKKTPSKEHGVNTKRRTFKAVSNTSGIISQSGHNIQL